MEMHPYTLIVALRCPFSISSDHLGSSLEQNKSSKKLVFVSTGCSLSFVLLEISSFFVTLFFNAFVERRGNV